MDVLKNVRLLRDNNVAVLFEENNLNTLDTKTSEMLLTTLSAVAQQESENISEHVKLGLQMKMNRGELIGFNRCYGHRNENDKLVIIDEEIVQAILKERCGARVNGRRIGNVGRKFAFSSRIRCGFCGNCFTRRTVVGKDREKIPSWSCTSFAKNGKESCTDSKTIREETIKEAFVDSYKLLSSNTNFETEEFLNLMQETMNENSGQDELEKFKKEFVDIKSKKSKLIDLMVEDKISENDYNEKVEKYNRKLEILENKIEQLKLLAEDKKSISDGLKKVKELLNSKDIMGDFDQEIFNAIVDYVIVGGYDENGLIDPYLIRFIFKREFDLSVPKDVPDEVVIQNNKIDLNSDNVLVDFINTRKYFSYERDENGKLNKVLRNGLRTRVECDIT